MDQSSSVRGSPAHCAQKHGEVKTAAAWTLAEFFRASIKKERFIKYTLVFMLNYFSKKNVCVYNACVKAAPSLFTIWQCFSLAS